MNINKIRYNINRRKFKVIGVYVANIPVLKNNHRMADRQKKNISKFPNWLKFVGIIYPQWGSESTPLKLVSIN